MGEKLQVRLTKTSAVLGGIKEGSTFVVTVPPGFEPVPFAFRTLKREYPAENPMEWTATEETTDA